jgi:hypothetical protein
MKMFTEVTEKPHVFLVCTMSQEGKLKFYESVLKEVGLSVDIG